MARTSKKEFERRRQIWLDALRSGKFEQGRGGFLKYEEAHCCLGVACVIFSDELKLTQKTKSDQAVTFFGDDDTYAPEVLVKYLGLRDQEGSYGDQESLARLNDDTKMTFKDIANFIEENADRVFK